jgi:hypothetical protein
MPRISTIRNNPILNPQNDVGAFGLSMNFRIPTGALVADWITLLQMERDGYLFAGSFAVLATLGASCTPTRPIPSSRPFRRRRLPAALTVNSSPGVSAS